ncbi:hypothetical protein C0992_008287 [Termitomyces sp. T32_za158]|nr:hypothetical protein C0992_008287 [Termitomyces sp. T32_za158]
MERSSSPLSDRSYAEAVTGSPPQQVLPLPVSPQAHEEREKMQVDSPRTSSPELPLSSMPMFSTQEQISMEQSVTMMEPMHIEVDNTMGRASEDVNALLQNNNAAEGWQTVTPKKNRKKTKKAAKKHNDSNKRPHSDSPIKDRLPKRQATENGSKNSGDEKGYRRTTSPEPALSVSALDYTDEEETVMEKGKANRASETPRAEARERTTERRATEAERILPSARPFLNRAAPPRQSQPDAPPGNPNVNTPDMREISPMKISTPTQGPQDHAGLEDQDDPDKNDPELWFETTEGDITTNGKGFRRTATPEGGWPRVYLAANPTFNIAAETLSEWEEIPEPVIWARLYRGKHEHSEAGKTKAGDMIKNVIKNLVYIEHDENVAVIFLDQDLPPRDGDRYPYPYHLLVVGLDPQQAQRLLDLEIVASPEATVFFLPRIPPRQLYILTMKGLTYNDTEGARGLVEDLAKRTFRSSPEIHAMIENLSNLPTEEALEQILDIRASFIPIKQRMGVARCWNLYFINDPGYDDKEYKLLRKKMRIPFAQDASPPITTRTTALSRGSRDGSDIDQMAQETELPLRTSQTKTKPAHKTRERAREVEASAVSEEREATEAEALAIPHEGEVAHRYTHYYESARH